MPGFGMCVSEKHGVVVTSGVIERDVSGVPVTGGLFVYALHDGTLLRVLCTPGHAKIACATARGSTSSNSSPTSSHLPLDYCLGSLCITRGQDTVLIAERRVDRVQERSLIDGAFVRFIGAHALSCPEFVDCDDEHVIVAGTTLAAPSLSSLRTVGTCVEVSVFSSQSGILLHQFRPDKLASSLTVSRSILAIAPIRLLADGRGIVLVDSARRELQVLHLDGRLRQLIRVVDRQQASNDDWGSPLDVLDSSMDGRICFYVLTTRGCLLRVDTSIHSYDSERTVVEDAVVLGEVIAPSSSETASDGVVPQNRLTPAVTARLSCGGLVVRECGSGLLNVFQGKTLRLEWLRACYRCRVIS